MAESTRGADVATARVEARRSEDLRPRYGGQIGHAESYFLKGNDPGGRYALWIKFTVFAPTRGAHVAEVWAIVFDRSTGQHRAEKETFPIAEAGLAGDPLSLVFGPCSLAERETHGILGSAGRVRWRLRIEGDAPPFRLLGAAWLYRSRAFPRTKQTSPFPDARLVGELEVDGEVIPVDGWPGCLGHNWGRGHVQRYAWVQCNTFSGHPGTWFEAVSAQISLGPITLPFLTLVYLSHQGRGYDFRGARHWWNRSVEVDLYRWSFCAKGPGGTLRGVARASPRDLVGLRYAQPDGSGAAACLNTKVAELTLEVQDRAGAPVATLRSDCGAALELVVPEDEDHGVRIYA